MTRSWHCGVVLLSALCSCLSAPVYAAATHDDLLRLQNAIAAQAGLIAQQKKLLEAQQARLEAQERKILLHQQQLQDLVRDSQAKEQKREVQRHVHTDASADKQIPVFARQPQRNEGSTHSQDEAVVNVAALPDTGGVLTPRGVVMFENSLDYTNTTNNIFTFQGVQIADVVLVGVVNATSARRQAVQNTARLRMGLGGRMETDIRVPYIYRSDNLTMTAPSSGMSSRNAILGHGIGDVDMGFSWQVNQGREHWPYFITNLRYKHDNADGTFDVPYNAQNIATRLPTGTGFKSADFNVTAIKISDPLVFFANVGYVANIGEDIGRRFGTTQINSVDPGDAVNASAGMSFAVNHEAAFSLGYKHSHVFSTLQKSMDTATGQAIDTRSDVLEAGALTLGVSYRISPSTNFNFNVEVGATDDAPDVRVGLRIPVRLGKIF